MPLTAPASRKPPSLHLWARQPWRRHRSAWSKTKCTMS